MGARPSSPFASLLWCRPCWCALVMLCVVVCRGAEPSYPFARRGAAASSPSCVCVPSSCCASSCVVGQSPRTHLHIVMLVPHPLRVYWWCGFVQWSVGARPSSPFTSSLWCWALAPIGVHRRVSLGRALIPICASSCWCLIPIRVYWCWAFVRWFVVCRGAEPWSAFMCWCWYVVVGACDLVVVGACRVMAGVHRHCLGGGDGDSSHSVDGPAGHSLQLLGGRSSPFVGGCGVVCGCLVSFVVWLVGILVGGPAGRSLQLLGGRSSPFAGGYGVVCGRSVSFMVW